MTAPRRPVVLTEAERLRRLRELGRNGDLSPIHPHPLDRPPMDTPDTSSAAPQPAQGAVLKQPVVQLLTVVAILAAAALAASEAGVLPSWVAAAAQAVIGLLAAFGIASPGIRKTS